MIKYTEISVLTTREGSELIAEAFFSIGGEGVAIYDRQDLIDYLKSERNWDYVEESILNAEDTGVRVVGYVKFSEFSLKKAEFDNIVDNYLKINALNFGSLETTYKEVGDTDYFEVWKKFYKPIHINNIVIVPKWIDYKKAKNETTVIIDPGMAFGTGEHESTQLSLELLSEINAKDKTVLDIGAGSGILGISALRLGAKSATLIDIDEVTLRFSTENAKINEVYEKTEILCGDLLSKEVKPAQIVFANITADILIRLSKSIYPFIEKDGVFICSGIIHKRAEEVKKAFEVAGLILDKCLIKGEWQALRYTKR